MFWKTNVNIVFFQFRIGLLKEGKIKFDLP